MKPEQPTPAQIKRAKVIARALFIGMVFGGTASTLAFLGVSHYLRRARGVDDEAAGWIGVSLSILGCILGGIAGVIVGEKRSRPH